MQKFIYVHIIMKFVDVFIVLNKVIQRFVNDIVIELQDVAS
jgi:hypothetical protein